MKISLKARAKINLSLEIIEKRPDSYHNLAMIMQSIDIYDKIDLELNDSKQITLQTNISFGEEKDNIAYKAAELFLRHTSSDKGCAITLQKGIPSEAGLAGGSTDAAAVLAGLNKLTCQNLKNDELIALATKLGADVPFCLFGGTMHASGIGDILVPLPFLELDLLIVKPDQNVSTKELFSSLDKTDYSTGETTERLKHAIQSGQLRDIEKLMVNRMYRKSLQMAPDMENIISKLETGFKCQKALMSGSGSTVFAIFDDKAERERAYAYFIQKYRHVYKTKTCKESITVDKE